jgi:hypothetical protein
MRRFLFNVCLIVAAGVLGAPAAGEKSASWLPEGAGIAVLASPTRVTVGDKILYSLRLVVPKGVAATLPVFGRTWGEFRIRDLGALPVVKRKDGCEEISRRYELSLYETGVKTIPPLSVVLRGQGGKVAEIDAGPVIVVSESVLDEDAKVIKDIKPPFKLTYVPIALIVGVSVGIAVAALAFLMLRRAGRKRETAPSPPRSPHGIAYAELERLRAMNLIAKGLVEEYYVRISDIVRRYVERRFSLKAPDRTTEEFLAEAGASGLLDPRARALVGDFLGQCDMVKFARYGPTAREIDGVYAAAKRFVDETAPTAKFNNSPQRRRERGEDAARRG